MKVILICFAVLLHLEQNSLFEVIFTTFSGNLEKFNLISTNLLGGAVAEWLVRWTPDRTVRVRALAGALRCVLGQDTLLS